MNLIIIPVHNEAKTVKETVESISLWCRESAMEYEILVIDDWSTDGTGEELLKLSDPKIRALPNRFDNGKGSALKTGYILSSVLYSLYDYDNIIFMDGDGQIDPSEIKTFLNLMNLYNADVVIGNKRHIYSNTEYGLIRRIVSRGYNLMTKFLFGTSFDDTQCGIKLFQKRALDSVINKVNVKQYAFDMELIIALKEMRFRVIDAPVNIKKQANAGSVKVKTIIRTFIDTVIIWLKVKRGYYR